MILKIFNGLSIRQKLFLIVFMSFGLLLTIIAWLINAQARDVANTEIQSALAQTGAIVAESWRNRFERISSVGNTLAKDQRIAPLVIERDAESLQDLAQEIEDVSELDILLFVDADGVVLARTDKPNQIGTRLKRAHHLIDTALTARESRGFMVTGGRIYQVVAQPIYDSDVNAQDIIRGAVVVAFQFSDAMAARIKRLTTGDIAVYVLAKNQDVVAPTLQFVTQPELRQPLVRHHDALFAQVALHMEKDQFEPIRLDLGETHYHIAVYPLEKSGGGILGYVMALKSRTQLLRPFDTIKRKILWIGFFCLMGASVLAWVLSGQISKPVQHLIDVTKEIQEGDYVPGQYEAQQGKSGKQDEISTLLTSIYQLGARLKDNEDLQDYLAKISEGLKEDEYARGVTKEFANVLSAIGGMSELDRSLIIDVDDDDDLEVTMNITGSIPVQEESRWIQVGSLFADGRFKILKELGAGGMGTVYLAHDTVLDETVALKVLFQVDDTQAELLKYEIKLARMITARNVLRTYDYGVSNKQIFISMEYVHGYDLHTLLQRSGGRIDNVRFGVILARQMTSAIASAHEQGIVHRDINPRNMMVSSQGILKVMDFGLALQVETAQSNNKIVGTPYYMAPEQITRQGIDERTDIYQLGAVFYRLFSGETPFRSQDLRELLASHMNDPVPFVHEKYPQVPVGIDNIIQKAMAKKPSDRYQGIHELQVDLQQFNI